MSTDHHRLTLQRSTWRDHRAIDDATDELVAEPPARPRVARTWVRGGGAGDRVFKVITLAAGLAVLLILALIAYSTTKEAWPAFKAEGLSFITSSDWARNNQFGALAFIYGTAAHLVHRGPAWPYR